MSKGFLGAIVLVVLVFVGISAFSGNGSHGKNKSSGKAGALTQHKEGLGKAGVTLVEYGDYQCPFCGQYYPILKQVQAEFNEQIYFQFRNFPLTSIHQNAFAGARAAEAAGMQNKYWEMHDLLYENQTIWSASNQPVQSFNQYATQLGLNLDQFKQDYGSDKVNDLINADMSEGNKLGVNGTPTFFLDNKQLDAQNLQSIQDFEKVINAEIAKKAPAKS